MDKMTYAPMIICNDTWMIFMYLQTQYLVYYTFYVSSDPSELNCVVMNLNCFGNIIKGLPQLNLPCVFSSWLWSSWVGNFIFRRTDNNQRKTIMPPLNTSHPSPATSLMGIPGLGTCMSGLGFPSAPCMWWQWWGMWPFGCAGADTKPPWLPPCSFCACLRHWPWSSPTSTSASHALSLLAWSPWHCLWCLPDPNVLHSQLHHHGIRLFPDHGHWPLCGHLSSTVPYHHTDQHSHHYNGYYCGDSGVAFFSPHPILLKQLPYCRTRIIAHTYCEFMAVLKLACVDTGATSRYSLSVASIIGSCDAILTAVSYVFIFQSVYPALPSREAGFKVWARGSHVCVILVFYSTTGFSIFTHRFWEKYTCTYPYFYCKYVSFGAPFLNPIVYGVRTKKIQEHVVKALSIKVAWF